MTSITVPGKTINELLQHWASTSDSDRPAFVSANESGATRTITRREVFEYAGRFAHKLMELGVKKGTIVCSTLPNSIERVICDMGIYLTGAISMNGQIFHSDGHDLLNSLNATKTQYVIVNPDAQAYNILKKESAEVLDAAGSVKSTSLPHLRNIIFCQRNIQDTSQDFVSNLQNTELKQLCIDVDPSDVATIMTSSGSTGYSKLIQLTHANICHFTKQVKAIYPLKGGDRFINGALLGWAGGFPQWYLGCGMTRYFLDLYDGPPTNPAKTVWQTIVSEKIIYGFLAPIHVVEILRNPAWWTRSEWKPEIICLAGQPIKKAHLEIIGKLCSAVDINYGMTECNLVTTHRITDPSSFKDGCAGFPGQGVSLKVVDKERNEVPQGVMGEILLQSPALTPGYVNNDEANSRAFTSDGWLCTDDVGYTDSEGRVHIEGRQSDSIHRGTYILYPGWLETEIKQLDKVKDVVVVPVPHPLLHHEICACIVTDCVPKQQMDSTGNRGSIYVNDPSSSSSVTTITSTKSEVENKLGNESEKSPVNGLDRVDGSSHSSQGGQLEQVRVSGMRKRLSVDYNLTKAKTDQIGSKDIESKFSDSNDIKDDLLQALEIEIRHQCNKSQLLAENDALRMVPKYYVFWEKFPLTSTGKINRKQVSKEASNVLGLQ